MREILDEFILGPVGIVFMLLFELFILPAIIFSKLVKTDIPTKTIESGLMKGKEGIDLKICFILSCGFWFCLWVLFTLLSRVE
ncbi:MAG: hypothetical protein V1858_02095 [Candidatus Gottesmanbacteria bacterium]